MSKTKEVELTEKEREDAMSREVFIQDCLRVESELKDVPLHWLPKQIHGVDPEKRPHMAIAETEKYKGQVSAIQEAQGVIDKANLDPDYKARCMYLDPKLAWKIVRLGKETPVMMLVGVEKTEEEKEFDNK